MTRPVRIGRWIAPCLAALAFPAVAQAQVAPSAAPQTNLSTNVFEGETITDDALRTIAGREDHAQVATASQTAGVSRNSVGDNSSTGDARISDSAFQNLSGLSILNVNTGNNVAINAAMNVNISITPGQ